MALRFYKANIERGTMKSAKYNISVLLVVTLILSAVAVVFTTPDSYDYAIRTYAQENSISENYEPLSGTPEDNECNEGGELAGLCNDAASWECGWFLARYLRNIIPLDGISQSCTSLIQTYNPEPGTPEDNECYEGGQMEGQCENVQFSWDCGWYLSRYLRNIISFDSINEECGFTLPEVEELVEEITVDEITDIIPVVVDPDPKDDKKKKKVKDPGDGKGKDKGKGKGK